MDTATVPVPAETFREVMSGVCTPVSVVTALDGSRPHGTTVSAFASLSADPPMVLLSLDRSSRLLEIVRREGRFGLNVLARDQSALATRFAGKSDAKFDGVDWERVAGLPRLPGSCGWLACAVSQLVDGGDHVVALAVVEAAESSPSAPLTYHARTFGTHSTVDD